MIESERDGEGGGVGWGVVRWLQGVRFGFFTLLTSENHITASVKVMRIK